MGKMTMEKLRGMLCDELDEITKKGELSAGSLDTVDKLTHSIKSIDSILMYGEYSEDGYEDGRSYGGNSYARGRGRNARRDSMGRYSSDGRYNDGGYSERRGYRRDNRGSMYSMDEAKENITEKLHEVLDEAPNEKIRNAIHRLINQIDEG